MIVLNTSLIMSLLSVDSYLIQNESQSLYYEPKGPTLSLLSMSLIPFTLVLSDLSSFPPRTLHCPSLFTRSAGIYSLPAGTYSLSQESLPCSSYVKFPQLYSSFNISCSSLFCSFYFLALITYFVYCLSP